MRDTNILGVHIANMYGQHDSSISYYNGEEVKHYTRERGTRCKHDVITSIEQFEKIIKDRWQLTFDDCDLIAVVCIDKKYISYHPFFKRSNVVVIDHHLAHYHSSQLLYDTLDKSYKGFVIDGAGEKNVCWTLYDNENVVDTGLIDNHGSIGSLLTEFGKQVTKIKVTHSHNGHADVTGKLMGLQSYGNISNDFLLYLENNVEDIKKINNIVSYRFVDEPVNYARTLFYHFENIILKFFKENFKRNDIIFYSGGVAMNVLWNHTLKKEFPNLIIHPHCGDVGLSLGALECARKKLNIGSRFKLNNFPFIEDDESPKSIPTDETIEHAAQLLANNTIIAWYQENGEVGPRALGNRSILMNPMIKDGKEKINSIKKRENYRPFGAVVLDEFKTEYFDVDDSFDNPYMLYAATVKNSNNLECITHIDGTCRIQTLKTENPILRKLLEKFYDKTGCPILLNTSLNLSGDPIMSYIEDINKILLESDLNYAFVGNKMIYEKNKLNDYS